MNELFRNQIDSRPISESVKEIVGDHMGIPGSTLDRDEHIIDDFGGDDLDKMELIMTVEELFEIDIGLNEPSEIQTVGDIIDAVEETKENG